MSIYPNFPKTSYLIKSDMNKDTTYEELPKVQRHDYIKAMADEDEDFTCRVVEANEIRLKRAFTNHVDGRLFDTIGNVQFTFLYEIYNDLVDEIYNELRDEVLG